MSNYKHKLLQEKIRLLAEELQVAHEDTANAVAGESSAREEIVCLERALKLSIAMSLPEGSTRGRHSLKSAS